MMMRLTAVRAIARTVYEKVSFVHANSANSMCGKWAKHLAGSNSSRVCLHNSPLRAGHEGLLAAQPL
jgi:hypothetical protein